MSSSSVTAPTTAPVAPPTTAPVPAEPPAMAEPAAPVAAPMAPPERARSPWVSPQPASASVAPRPSVAGMIAMGRMSASSRRWKMSPSNAATPRPFRPSVLLGQDHQHAPGEADQPEGHPEGPRHHRRDQLALRRLAHQRPDAPDVEPEKGEQDRPAGRDPVGRVPDHEARQPVRIVVLARHAEPRRSCPADPAS